MLFVGCLTSQQHACVSQGRRATGAKPTSTLFPSEVFEMLAKRSSISI